MGLAVSAAFGLGLVFGGDDDGWTTYRDQEYGFEIRYPEGWTAAERAGPGVRLVPDANIADPLVDRQAPAVIVILDSEGDWCGSGRIESRPITVSGVRGEEHSCYPPDDLCLPAPGCEPTTIVRFFQGRDGTVYRVLGQTDGDVDMVRRVVQSFRFIGSP